MSSRSPKKSEIDLFAARFIEVCGSSRPADIQRLLNISYQSAKNYLNGRVPEPSILIKISDRTGYSIHWLLTGEGEKLVGGNRESTPILPRQIEVSVRRICVEVINEVLGKEQAQPKVVVLQSANLMSEKAENSDRVPLPGDRSQ